MHRKNRFQEWLLRSDQPFDGTVIEICDEWSAVIQQMDGNPRPNIAQLTLGFVGALRNGRGGRTMYLLPAAVERKCGLKNELYKALKEFHDEFC